MAEAFDMYQQSEIGKALTETLIQMVGSGALSPELAITVLLQFDKVPSAAAAAPPLASSPRTSSPPTLQISRTSMRQATCPPR